MEEWRKIEGYDNYEVSNYGKVRSLDYNRTGETRIMKPSYNTDMYLQVKLRKDRKYRNFQVHRLVAQSFLPNPDNLPQVNHKNENKEDNRVENLEWCTNQYNVDYSLSKPVLQFSQDGNFIQEFKSTNEASRQTGIIQQNISQCCNGKGYHHTAGGYIWKFK